MNSTAVDAMTTADDIALLRESVREALKSLFHGSPDERWPDSWREKWGTLDDLGLWSTIEPPDGSVAVAAAVVEELGRALYPGPACEALAASYLLTQIDDSALLPGVAATGPLAAFFTEGITGKLDPAVQVGPETLLIVAGANGDLFVTPSTQPELAPTASLDVSRRISQLHFDRQSARALSMSSGRDLAGNALAARRLLYCADTLGCVEHVLERTTEYASQRTTFGSPIGKYQGVAHRLVEHAVTAQQMRLVLDAAIAGLDDGADVARRVAIAETFFWRRGADIISDCIQLAGAIGFTWEFGHHFYLRRVVQNASLGGGSGRPHRRLAQESTW